MPTTSLALHSYDIITSKTLSGQVNFDIQGGWLNLLVISGKISHLQNDCTDGSCIFWFDSFKGTPGTGYKCSLALSDILIVFVRIKGSSMFQTGFRLLR